MQKWCMCIQIDKVRRDGNSTCEYCGGRDAYGLSSDRPDDKKKKVHIAHNGARDNTKIFVNMLNTGLPPINKSGDNVNMLLALWKNSEDAAYLSPWRITNAEYYHRYSDKYLGWIELEDIE